MDYSKIKYYILFIFLYILAQSFSMWGQYVTLPFKNLSMWQAFKMAIPFAWLDWLVMPFVVLVGSKYDLVTPTQDILLLIIIQFSLVLVINKYYLKKELFTSDYIAFLIILAGFVISFQNTISKLFNIPIPEKHQPDEKTDADGKPIVKTDADGKPIEKASDTSKP